MIMKKSETLCFGLLSSYRQNGLKNMPKYGIIYAVKVE